MNKDVDPQALSAAIAGFLACHVLTCRFLVQEGIVDRERFIAYLETAIDEMSPGIEDKRALFSLNRLVDGLRTAPTGIGNGMLEIISAADAPFIARMSYGLTWSTLSGMPTTCVS